MQQRRHRRGNASLALAATAAAVACALCTSCVSADTSLAFSSSGDGGSSGSGGALAEVGEYVAKGLAAEFKDGERRLVLIQESVWTEPVCDGQPLVMRKSDVTPPNGGCLPEQTQYNLSCTCLLGFDNSSEWRFHLRAPTSGDAAAEEMPVVMEEGEELAVQSMMTINLPEVVAALRIVGVPTGAALLPLRITPSLTSSGGVVLATSKSSSTLTAVEVANVDLSEVPICAGFVPASVETLTFSNCNISAFNNGFLDSFSGLNELNVSSNSLSSIYSSLSTMSPETIFSMRSIDISNNNFTAFPSYLLQFENLHMLNLSGNPISNFTITTSVFNALTAIPTVIVDSPSPTSYNCTQGEWKTLSNESSVTFCVVNSTTNALDASNDGNGSISSTETSSGTSSNWSLFLLVAAIGGCLVGFVLLFLAVKLSRTLKTQSGRTASRSDALIEDLSRSRAETSKFDNDTLAPTLNAELQNDPIMITYRIPYRELRIAKCISKGGFGLVYSGVYDRRRVAIKRIHPDRSGDITQIRQFIREITLMATLTHPRIVEFIGVAWDSIRNLSAVTEYMDRGDLRDVLHTARTQPALRDPRFTWLDQKLKIALHIAEGLAYLHSLHPRVIHRDLKSKNVLLNSEMDAKLSDFGISRERRFEGDTHMTAGIGTSFWIAPEILLGRDYDEHADIYSFGVVLSEIDTDDYPYWNSGNVPPETVPGARKRQENDILKLVAVGKLRPTFYDDCPKEILALAASCLEGKPEDRPSAAELVISIEKISAELKSQLAVSPASIL